jgi:SLT domain-containing protein
MIGLVDIVNQDSYLCNNISVHLARASIQATPSRANWSGIVGSGPINAQVQQANFMGGRPMLQY